jgi:hypothetical protein
MSMKTFIDKGVKYSRVKSVKSPYVIYNYRKNIYFVVLRHFWEF